MQEWESLKLLLSNINREIERVSKDIDNLERLSAEAGKEWLSLELRTLALRDRMEERALKIESEAKQFREEVYRMFGENKKTLMAVIIALLSSGAILGKTEVIRLVSDLFGGSK